MSLKEKILEFVSRPNYYCVTFEHESYGQYYCTCYIDNRKVIYKGVGEDENSAFEKACKNMDICKKLQISLDEFKFKTFDTAEVIKQDGYRITVLLDSKNQRKIIREIYTIDEDEFIIWDKPGLLVDFTRDCNIELISSDNNFYLYRYTRHKGPLYGDGGLIKVDKFKMIIASKMEWIS